MANLKGFSDEEFEENFLTAEDLEDEDNLRVKSYRQARKALGPRKQDPKRRTRDDEDRNRR